jgi:mannobiose 2-epimerase
MMPIPNPFWRAQARRRLAEIFERNIVAFWRPRALAEEGGYHLDWDQAGARLPRAPATVIGQSRMLYFFARLARSRFGDAFAADAAHRGFAYLQAALHDPVHGGYFWDARDRVAGPGEAPAAGAPGWRRTKHILGQAFALIGIAEYARSFPSPAAVAAARTQFELIERHARDRDGGYREVMARDWSPAGPEQKSLLGPYPGNAKTSGAHVHILEACMALERIDPEPRVRTAMGELAALLLRYGTPRAGHGSGGYESGFFADYGAQCLPIGHCLKEVWYRLVALERLGAATTEARAIAAEQYAFLHAAGFDSAEGGFFNLTALDGTRVDPAKIWWVEAEGLLGSLIVALRCGSALARRDFLATLDWIERHQVDWDGGEWHAEIVGRSVKPSPKGGPWKEAYHQGRAMLDGLELLGAE